MVPPARIVRAAIILLSSALLIVNSPPLGPFGSTPRPDRIELPASRSLFAEPDSATRRRLSNTFSRLPLCFQSNEGQAEPDVRFISAGNGHTLLLKPNEAVIALRPPMQVNPDAVPEQASQDTSVVRMRLIGADKSAEMRGLDSLPARVNYFIGNDPAKWHTGIATFARVICENVYPGIALAYYGSRQQLEYDFVVAPGADAGRIRIAFDGGRGAEISDEGDLVLHTPVGDIRHNKPVAYQETETGRRKVPAAFVLSDSGEASFELGDYDNTRELVIDPVLVYSTYLGGSNADFGRAIVVDSAGNAYIAGDSQSANFLTKASPANSDVFVGKMHHSGFFFSYSFFGGSKNDFATGLAVDADGNTYICGTTQSDDYPRLDSINAVLSGPSDAFVSKSNAEGDKFLYSTLVGGSGDEAGVSVAIDGSGNAYITGRTSSMDFPAVGAIQPTYGGGVSDAFVAKVASDGAALEYSTYLGGSGTENLLPRSAIAVDAVGNAYVTGDTLSGDFPTMNPLQPTKSGAAFSHDAFVSKINAAGSGFDYSTYLGGSEDDFGLGVAVDSGGNAYVTGRTRSTSFPSSSARRPSTGTTDAFVAKLNSAGSAYGYLTFVGGNNGDESGNSIAVDSAGIAVITGEAGEGFPTMRSVQSYFTGGDSDVFVARLGSNGVVNFATYMGGSGSDIGRGIAVDPAGSIYITGTSGSADYLTEFALRDRNQGGTDMFMSKIDPNADPNGPVILKVLLDGKQLTVFGQNFDDDAVVRVNDVPKGTKSGEDPSQILISKKGGKKIKPGRTVQIQVENSDGKRSNFFFFTRPSS